VTLLSRLAGDDVLAGAVERYRAGVTFPELVPAWPLPGHDPALRRVLTGHTGWVNAVAVGPDGSWLASAGNDGTVRLWNVADGGSTVVIRVDGPLFGCAVFPDGRCVAAVGSAGIYLFTYRPGRAP
jgi:WD40 repeat protein